MELFVKDRIYIPQILPQTTTTYIDFNLKREIINKVALKEEDKEKYEMREDEANQRTVWSNEKDLANPLVVNFTSQETDFLVKAIEKLPEAPYPDAFWLTVEKIYNSATQSV